MKNYEPPEWSDPKEPPKPRPPHGMKQKDVKGLQWLAFLFLVLGVVGWGLFAERKRDKQRAANATQQKRAAYRDVYAEDRRDKKSAISAELRPHLLKLYDLAKQRAENCRRQVRLTEDRLRRTHGTGDGEIAKLDLIEDRKKWEKAISEVNEAFSQLPADDRDRIRAEEDAARAKRNAVSNDDHNPK